MKAKLLMLLIVGVWLGMVCGISFLEAPLKFQAPNITTILGLGIGKLVFNALNKIELIFSFFTVGWLILQYKFLNRSLITTLGILIIVVTIQSFWLLPILDLRIDNLLQGIEVTKTTHHFYYIALELTKVVLLIISFVKIYKHD
jgi:C4-dicarboxylate transporter